MQYSIVYNYDEYKTSPLVTYIEVHTESGIYRIYYGHTINWEGK